MDLYLPIAEEIPVSVAPPDALENYQGQGELILVVDDNEIQRVVAADMLRELGYRVDTVHSGEGRGSLYVHRPAPI